MYTQQTYIELYCTDDGQKFEQFFLKITSGAFFKQKSLHLFARYVLRDKSQVDYAGLAQGREKSILSTRDSICTPPVVFQAVAGFCDTLGANACPTRRVLRDRCFRFARSSLRDTVTISHKFACTTRVIRRIP